MMLTSKEWPSDLSKVLGEWALAAGRYLQSKQTGYIHLYYGETQQGAHTIPLVENALFALALLRSRLVEQVQEAKVLLKSLLAFQNLQKNNSYGNFPVYFHQYPICHDSTLGLQLLAPFYWILKQFGHILGVDLRSQLEQAACLALEQCMTSHHQQPFSYSFAVRLAAAQEAYGGLWGRSNWQQEGREQLEQLVKRQLEGWYTTSHLGNLLIGLQMVYPSLIHSPWQDLWQRMEHTWHEQTGTYIGPCLREWQEREEPQSNLYDLYAGYFARCFSRRTTLLQPDHLYAVLILPSSDKFYPCSSNFVIEGELKEQKWQTLGNAELAYTVLEKKGIPHPSLDPTYTPFRLIWGDLHRVHSLVCQGGSYEKVEYKIENNSIQLIFDLKDKSSEERLSQREIEFFIDFQPDLFFSLNRQTANTFEIGQPLILSLGQRQLKLTFDLLQGEGDFLGHVMRGNRPSQMDNKGEKRFQSYDWAFFLRTIRRQKSCRLLVTLLLN